jgi:hypothetical protein
MFDIGQVDTITIKKPATTGRTDGNRTLGWDIIIEDQRCRKVQTKKVETDETGAQIVIIEDHVIVNYSGTEIDETCIATVNGSNYEIKAIDVARGWGRNFLSIKIKARL